MILRRVSQAHPRGPLMTTEQGKSWLPVIEDDVPVGLLDDALFQ